MIKGVRLCVLTICMVNALSMANMAIGQTFPAPEGVSPRTNQVIDWDHLTLRERAEVWPHLTPVQRSIHWRFMTDQERQALRRALTLKQQTDDQDSANYTPRPRRMTPAEKELMRRQVIEVHIEIRRGIPYDCKDPLNCRNRVHYRYSQRNLPSEADVPVETEKVAPAPSIIPVTPPEPPIVGP